MTEEPVGIDIGSCFTRVACYRGDRDITPIELIENIDGKFETPSIVANRDGELIAGQAAVIYSQNKPNTAICNVKKLLSQTQDQLVFQADEIKKIVKNDTISITNSGITLCGKTFTTTQLLAQLLRVHQQSLNNKGKSAKRATIAVPASFTVEARQNIKKAATEAGFTKVTIVNEATAAVVNYQKTFNTEDGLYLVFDCAATSCTATIVSAKGAEYSILGMSVLDGNSGEAINQTIQKKVLKQLDKSKVDEIEKNEIALSKISSSIEEAKTKSVKNKIEIIAPIPKSKSITMTISMDQLNTEIDDILDNIEDQISDFFKQSGIDDSNPINYLVLIGGTSSIPGIRERVIDACQIEKVETFIDPRSVVAVGAALIDEKILFCKKFKDLYAGIKPISSTIQEKTYLKCALGIQITNGPSPGYIKKLIEPGTIIPKKKAFLFKTTKSHQNTAIYHIYAFIDNKWILKNTLTMSNLPDSGIVDMRIVFTLQQDEFVIVQGSVAGSKQKTSVHFSL